MRQCLPPAYTVLTAGVHPPLKQPGVYYIPGTWSLCNAGVFRSFYPLSGDTLVDLQCLSSDRY